MTLFRNRNRKKVRVYQPERNFAMRDLVKWLDYIARLLTKRKRTETRCDATLSRRSKYDLVKLRARFRRGNFFIARQKFP